MYARTKISPFREQSGQRFEHILFVETRTVNEHPDLLPAGPAPASCFTPRPPRGFAAARHALRLYPPSPPEAILLYPPSH
jgi:hypothetical protein